MSSIPTPAPEPALVDLVAATDYFRELASHNADSWNDDGDKITLLPNTWLCQSGRLGLDLVAESEYLRAKNDALIAWHAGSAVGALRLMAAEADVAAMRKVMLELQETLNDDPYCEPTSDKDDPVTCGWRHTVASVTVILKREAQRDTALFALIDARDKEDDD